FSHDRATPATHTLSLHDALPIFGAVRRKRACLSGQTGWLTSARHRSPSTARGRFKTTMSRSCAAAAARHPALLQLPRRHTSRSRSEEHTSELQSPYDLVCRLLLE